ncbi:hypothetical protein WJX79_011025 [Trebouxia sp. C0005]
MKSTLLKDERRRLILQSTDWLARRAAGISHVSFEIDDSAPQNSEARFFMEMQLPYLLGQLYHHGRQINIALSTDTEMMTRPLMQDRMLLSCLGQNLVRLTLTEYSEDPMLSTVDIDCLSGSFVQSWNSLSMFYIGQLNAALVEAFKHRVPTERPYCESDH